MMKIILMSLLMVQIIIFFLDEVFKIDLKDNKIKIFLYVIIPIIIYMLYVKLGLSKEFIMYSILIGFLIVISIVDYYTMYIYDITTISGIIVQGFIILITRGIIIDHLMGLVFGFMIPYIVVKITKGVGSGDIGVYALCCFCIGIEKCIYIIPISFIIGGIYGMYMLITKKKRVGSYVPLAPWISLGTLAVIFLEQNSMLLI